MALKLVLLVMMLVSKKSDTSYLAMCFFLLCAVVAFEADRGARAMPWFYALLSFIGLPIVSFWYWPLKRQSGTQIHAMSLKGDRNALIMAAMQTLLAVGYLGLAAGILRLLRVPAADSAPSEDEAQFVRDSAS